MKLIFLLIWLLMSSWADEVAVPSAEVKPAKTFIITEITNKDFEWSDLSLKSETSFTQPIAQAWKNWINENQKGQLQGAEICEGECLAFYRIWQEKTAEELKSLPPSIFSEALWLRISLQLRKISTESPLEQNYGWEGRVILTDGMTKNILGSFTIDQSEKVWRGLDAKAFNSALASQIYRLVLPGFHDFSLKTAHTKAETTAQITVRGHKNLSDVMTLSEELKARGKNLGLQISLGTIKKDEAKLNCLYHGEAKEFSDLLSELKELKSSVSYGIISKSTESSHEIQLVIKR